MELMPKQLCWMKTTYTWMQVTKRMKYLGEHGTRMNFWMIIRNRKKSWMKLLVGLVYE